jgi:hypothetical protein
MNLGRWEWAIGEAIILPLLFFELWRVTRSQRHDREAAARQAAADHPDPASQSDPAGNPSAPNSDPRTDDEPAGR